MTKNDIESNKFKLALTPSTKNYSCFIDGYENGKFHGWAINDSDSSKPVNLELFIGNEIIGSAICNIYREDLKDAGVGDGCYGFSIEPLIAGIPSGKHSIQAVCDQDFKIKDLFSWVVRGICTPSLDDVSAMVISGSFQFDRIIAAHIEYQILIDENIIHTSFTDPTDQNLHKFDCRIPDKYFDGNPHVISIKMLEDKMSSSTIQILSPILTPWSHLKQSNKYGASTTPCYSGIPAMMTRRLSALANRIEPLLKLNSINEIKNVYNAYEILSNSSTEKKEYHELVMKSPEKKPLISIIIPVHNQFSATYECLASFLLYSNNCDYEVIIVDDASTDKTIDINHIIKNIAVIKNANNVGFLKSCNIGAKFAKGEYLVFLNNDTEVGEYWLDEMLDVFRRIENVGIVGCKLIFPNGMLQEAGGVVWENGEPWNLGRDDSAMLPDWNYVRQVDYVSGAALMIPKHVWNAVNGFSEEFAPCYFEDTDLAYKVKGLGYKVMYTPHAEVIHHEGMSNGTDLSKGLKKYQTINQPIFSSKWIRLLENNGRVGKDLWKNKERGIRYRALVIDSETPQPDTNAGSHAAIQEIKLLQSFDFKVTFIPENLAHFGKYTTELQKIGVECQHSPFTSSIEELLKKKGQEYDLVYITRFHVAEKYLDVIKKYTHAKIILNNADLHFLRELRSILYKNDDQLLPAALEIRDKELAIMRKMDVILSYNESEHAVITSHILKSSNIFKCPWVLPTRSHTNSYRQRSGIAFLGGYKHLPNIEAVEFLAKRIMPILFERNPNIRLYIYGSNTPKEFDEFISENIEVVGYVENLESIFEQHRLFVAPLFSGAGIKGKVLDAISWGLPTILSPIALEATGLVDEISTLTAESENEWVEAILKLYSNEALWDKLSKNSLELAATTYTFENARKQFSKPLNYLGFYS